MSHRSSPTHASFTWWVSPAIFAFWTTVTVPLLSQLTRYCPAYEQPNRFPSLSNFVNTSDTAFCALKLFVINKYFRSLTHFFYLQKWHFDIHFICRVNFSSRIQLNPGNHRVSHRVSPWNHRVWLLNQCPFSRFCINLPRPINRQRTSIKFHILKLKIFNTLGFKFKTLWVYFSNIVGRLFSSII